MISCDCKFFFVWFMWAIPLKSISDWITKPSGMPFVLKAIVFLFCFLCQILVERTISLWPRSYLISWEISTCFLMSVCLTKFSFRFILRPGLWLWLELRSSPSDLFGKVVRRLLILMHQDSFRASFSCVLIKVFSWPSFVFGCCM